MTTLNNQTHIILLVSDWSRWALKGHKGFKLTQDELKSGIDGRMITRGLKKDSDGKWVWVDEYVIKQEEVAATVLPLEEELMMPEPVADESVAERQEDQSAPSPPSVPSQNGHMSPPSNTQPMSPVAQPIEEVIHSAPPVEEVTSETSDVSSIYILFSFTELIHFNQQKAVDETLKEQTPQPSLEAEKVGQLCGIN